MWRTLYATPAVLANTVAIGAFTLATTPFTQRFHDLALKTWAHRVLSAVGVELQVEGAERLDPGQRYIFMANHQSHLDVPCLVSAVPNPVRFVAKRSLARIPLFGAAMKAIGNIDIDRGDRQDTLRRMHEAQRGIAQQVSVAFFAEGTRSADGELRPFKRGGVRMALALGVPIVPVAIWGTIEILPKGARRFHKPGPVRVAIAEPIVTGPDTPAERERLLAQVQSEVGSMYQRLRAARAGEDQEVAGG
ncbi:MAG TPA: 1-acyl-sn-glycerol-3-phosphate acyltransferase [Myxococcales bacterium]|nr:1-acyl-sn-glycerol-3-phosphate acyltransferase [Myxococcales bacterium]